MLTLIMCLFQDFIYIIKIHQNKKNITKIKITKKIILKVKWNRGNTYLLIWWRLKIKTSNLCRNLEGNERKKNQRRGELRTEEMTKWTEEAVAGIYRAVLPTESPTEIKKTIILIYSVGEASKIRR